MTKPTGRPLGRPKTKEYVTLMARVPEELADRAKRYARLHQQPISVVLRDGLEMLLEEDRYRPFVSDRKWGDDIVSDRNTETSRPAELQEEIVSDRNGESAPIVSDRNADVPLPDVPLPALVSDTKAAAL